MTPEIKAKLEELAKTHLSQFCIYEGTPHWIAGERDFMEGAEAGYALGVKEERERCQGIAVAMTKAFDGASLSELLGWQIVQAIVNPPGDV